MGCGVSRNSTLDITSNPGIQLNHVQSKSQGKTHKTSRSKVASEANCNSDRKRKKSPNKEGNDSPPSSESSPSSGNSLSRKRLGSKIAFLRTQLSRIEESPVDERPTTPRPEVVSIGIQVDRDLVSHTTQTDANDGGPKNPASGRADDEISDDSREKECDSISSSHDRSLSAASRGDSPSPCNMAQMLSSDVVTLKTERPDIGTVEVSIQVTPNRKSCSTQTSISCHLTKQVVISKRFENSPKNHEAQDLEGPLFRKVSIKSGESPTKILQQLLGKSEFPIDTKSSGETLSVDIGTRILHESGDAEINELLLYHDMISPLTHIEKQLLDANNNCNQHNEAEKDCCSGNCGPNDSLNKFLDDIESSLIIEKSSKLDASVQTEGDSGPEVEEFAPRPPPFKKKEMIGSVNMFKEVDTRVSLVTEEDSQSLKSLVNFLCQDLPNDLFKVRAIFKWVTNNMKYDWNRMGTANSSEEILRSCEGVCKDHCQIFEDLCREANIRVKRIEGYAKGYDYRPGQSFKPGEDITHNWNAVYIMNAWHLIDPTWATGYTDHSGKFQRKTNEHFFLTDPEAMIWTHFPYNELEAEYSRWQLLEKPKSLDEFNALPKVTPYFFEYNLKIRSETANTIVFRIQKEIKIGANEPMRFKYKLYPADQVENATLNSYVFCQLKDDRLIGSFLVTPPVEDRYVLKIFTKPERDMRETTFDNGNLPPPTPQSQSNLHNCVTFLLQCTRARRYLQPYPINELPWGPTQSFYDFKMRMVNQAGPVITTWGGKRRLVLESKEMMLLTHQVSDSDGIEIEAKSIAYRDDSANKITFTISPPRVGMFKLMIFGMPKPKQKGKWRLPLLATFLIECKIARIVREPPEEVDPPPITVTAAELEAQVYQTYQYQ